MTHGYKPIDEVYRVPARTQQRLAENALPAVIGKVAHDLPDALKKGHPAKDETDTKDHTSERAAYL